MFVIGITGGIGCGKSTLAHYFSEAGVTVLDADAISRKVTAAGGAALAEIKECFGSDFFSDDGALDRDKMASEVFSDRLAVDQLSKIVHSYVVREIKAGLARAKRKKEALVVLDVPIPIEDGFLKQSDLVIVIWAAEKVRLARLQQRGMSEEEASRRMRMQMSEAEYKALADLVFYNDGDTERLKDFFEALVKEHLNIRGISLPEK